MSLIWIKSGGGGEVAAVNENHQTEDRIYS